MKSISRFFLLTTLAAVAASAGTISIEFDNPNQTGLPGETLSFYGVITHSAEPGPDIYLNSDSLNFALPGAILIDNFFANVPIFLAPGQSSGSINLFDIVLTDPPGTYPGSYQLIGGADEGANTAADILAQANFSVTVVPEPATVMLLCAVLPIVILRRSTARSARKHQYGPSGN